jgi:hypothetical protein
VQFVSGTSPALVGRAAMLAGESSAAAGTLYPEQEVKDAVNQAYLELWTQARQRDSEYGTARAFFNTTADGIAVDISSLSIEGEITDVAVELDGKDLSTDSAASWTYLKPSTVDVALRGYRAGSITTTEFYVYLKSDSDQKLNILAPPSTGGTNSCMVRYQGALTALSADTDAPILPLAHHDAICYKAAVELRMSRDLEYQDQFIKAVRLERAFLAHIMRGINDPEGQIVARGRVKQAWATKAGTVQRP